MHEIKDHLSAIHKSWRREKGCIAKEKTKMRKKNHTGRSNVVIQLDEREGSGSGSWRMRPIRDS